jgi:hypothetical protein
MSYSCPVNFETVDSYVARFVAFIVSSLLVVYMFTFDIFILYALFLDFIVRLFYERKYSVVFQIAKFLKKFFKLKNSPTDGGAKRLAGYFGIFFISLLIAANYLNLQMFSMIVSVIFLTCALLEAFFSYCVGCKIYYIIKKIFPKFMS